MPRFERLTEAGVERFLMKESRRRAFMRYLQHVEAEAEQTGRSILEIIEADLVHEMEINRGVRIPQLFRVLRKPPDENIQKQGPEAETVIYSFSTAYGNLVYYPKWRQAMSPLLPNGEIVKLSPKESLFLEALISNPGAPHTVYELHLLLERKFNEAPGPIVSNRVERTIFELRKKLGDDNQGRGLASKFRLIGSRMGLGYFLLSKKAWNPHLLVTRPRTLWNREDLNL